MSDMHLLLPLSEFFNEISKKFKDRHRPTHFVTLPDIHGKRYIIGCVYPDDIGNVEFIYHEWEGYTAKIQCHFFVDCDGQFWISEGEPGISKTFVNSETLEKPRVLRNNDSISFGKPRNFGENKVCPVFLVKFEEPKRSISSTESLFETPSTSSVSCLSNKLIFSILTYLGIKDLKHCRLVCRNWNQLAKVLLEERGTISFDFSKSYGIPKNSIRPMKYLHETKDFRIRKLKVQTGNENVSQKAIDDFEKLLNAEHNFTSLTINTTLRSLESVGYFRFVLRKLGGQLAELEFGENFVIEHLPRIYSQNSFAFSFESLKKYSHFGSSKKWISDEHLNRWISTFIPNIIESVEQFSFGGNLSHFYLGEIVKCKPQNLKSLTITAEPNLFTPESHNLLQLKIQLQTLILEKMEIRNQEVASQIGEFLNFQSANLIRLRIGIIERHEDIKIRFPKWPNLQELSFQYSPNLKVQLDGGKIDYKVHFPVIRILELLEFQDLGKQKCLKRSKISRPYEWETYGSVFSEFFPSDETVCKTVTRLSISALKKCRELSGEEFKCYKLKIFKISDMFPEVQIEAKQGLGLTQKVTFCTNCYPESDIKEDFKVDEESCDGGSPMGYPIPSMVSEYFDPDFPQFCNDEGASQEMESED